MHAIVYHHYGTPDVLEFSDIEMPVPAVGEVLIWVRAASVKSSEPARAPSPNTPVLLKRLSL